MDPKRTYIDPTQESGRALFTRGIEGTVLMLNMLRFRETADYSATPELAPETPISGAEAYRRYMAHTEPYLKKSGGKLILQAEGGAFFIGPPDERWDLVLLVRQASLEAFLAFASDPGYLAGIGHRTAALEDSRLLPLVEKGIPGR